MSATPLVSILTPSYNQGRFIGDCLRSVAEQTYRPLEHVVVDGASTDNTLNILESAGSHVRWESAPDKGQAHALNKALLRSRGKIIGWVNSDDGYADRRAVEWAVGTFASNPEVDLVYGHSLLVNERNQVLNLLFAPPFNRSLLKRVHYVYQPTVFIRREALQRQPYFLREDLHFVLDRELVLRLTATGRVARLPRVLAIDRHQRARKVLSPALVNERSTFDAELGVAQRERTSLRARSVKLGFRLRGVPTVVRLRVSIDPAIGLEFRSLVHQLRLQILMPRRFMAF